MRRTRGFVAAALIALAACGGESEGTRSPETRPAGERPTLRFSAIPHRDQTLLRQKYRPVAEYLTRQLGVQVEYDPSADYGASVEKFRNGDVMLAWFGGLTGVQARHRVPGARAIATGKEDLAFVSYFIAHRDTGLERSQEFPRAMAGKSFTFGSKSSTSGRLMPEHFVRTLGGRNPEEFFSSVGFTENHDQTAEVVASGRVQVGALDYTVYERRVKEGKTDPEVVRVIWKTPPYVDYQFTAHPDLETTFGRGFTERLQKALVGMTDATLLAAFERTGFVPTTNEAFEPIRRIAGELGFLRQ